ncbi:MAG: alpha-L-fucosidase [Spirochaetia bacterium]|nr:alpha-L-fucosidase [Spirochaetia bacterium]
MILFKRLCRFWIGILLTAAVLPGFSETAPSHCIEIEPGDSREQIIEKAANVIPKPRQAAYMDREFIGFIHFGPNTYTGNEWGNGFEDPMIFAPSSPDTDQWCRIMKEAGMTQVVLTVKHHDGFCLWQTRYTNHSVASSLNFENGHGDILKSLSESCRKYGLKLGVYLSPADLYQIESPEGLYGNRSPYTERIIPRPVEGRPFADKRTFRFKVDDYNEYFLNQLFELLTEYGPIHEVWFDGATPKSKGGQQYAYKEWYELIRTLAPEAVIFGKGPDARWCGNEAGHTRKSEWSVIPLPVMPEECTWPDMTDADLGSREKLYGARCLYFLPAEVDTSIRHGWFYRDDTSQQVRSADNVFDIYERSVGGNAVLILNIPPNREGRFSLRDEAVLKEVGRRIREVYGNPFGAPGSVFTDSNPKTFEEGHEFILNLDSERTVTRFLIREAYETVGQRIESFRLQASVDGKWQTIGEGTCVGRKKILRFNPVTTDQFRVQVTSSRLPPAVAEMNAYYAAPQPDPVFIEYGKNGKVKLGFSRNRFTWKLSGDRETVKTGQTIRYTLDGSEPHPENSNLYKFPFRLPEGGVLKIRPYLNGEPGPLTEVRLGLPGSAFDSIPDRRTIDGHPETVLTVPFDGTAPEKSAFVYRLKTRSLLSGISYLPPQTGRNGKIEAGRIEISNDGETWIPVREFRFGNLINDPTERFCEFENPVEASCIRLIPLQIAENGTTASVAEIKIFVR